MKKREISFFTIVLIVLSFASAAAPNNPYPTLVSLDGSNKTNQDLNCYSLITDLDSVDLLNVTVIWYNNSIAHLILDYNNSYSNGTTFSAILKSGNTTRGHNWRCAMRLYDGVTYSEWKNSSNLTILNSPPSFSTIYPANNSYLSINNLILNYSTTDADNDPLIYTIYNATSSQGSFSLLNTSSSSQFNWTNIAEGSYLWYVNVTDSSETTFSGIYNFTIDRTLPTITNINSSSITSSFAIITWNTDEQANSSLTISPSATYSSSNSLTTSHSISLSGLSASTTYSYTVISCDAAGNCQTSPSSFTTNSSAPTDTDTDTTTGNVETEQTITSTTKNYDFEISGLRDVLASPKADIKFNLELKNTGKFSLTQCGIEIYSNISDWFIVNKSKKSINYTKTENFNISLKIPENAKIGNYSANISVNCSQLIKSKEIKITIEKKFVEITIKEMGINKKKFFVIYTIKEILGLDNNLTIKYWIEKNKEEIVSLTKNLSIKSNETMEVKDEIELPKDLGEANLTVFIKAVSQNYTPLLVSRSLSNEEYKSLLTGAVIGGGNTKKTFLLILISLSIFVVFFILSRAGKKFLKKKPSEVGITVTERRVVKLKIPGKKDFNIP